MENWLLRTFEEENERLRKTYTTSEMIEIMPFLDGVIQKENFRALHLYTETKYYFVSKA